MTQDEALNILKMGHNVYLTGSAGSGKTYVLNRYIDYLKEHGADPGITASTGIAATHMNGMTIHSWSGLGIRDSITRAEIELLKAKSQLSKRFEYTDVLIIDEVSMLHHFRLDLLDRVCRGFKDEDKPFGGIQVVLSGDFFQLPPVSRGGEPEAQFIYKSDAWKEMDIKICYLEGQYRQASSDPILEVLNDVRGKLVSEETMNHLRGRYKKAPRSQGETNIIPTKLYTHNADIDRINDKELEVLEGDTHHFFMTTKGSAHLVEGLKKSCLAPDMLTLKKGARVMFVKNNYDEGYVNGTLGMVIDFDDEKEFPIVETVNGNLITVEPETWSIQDEGKIKAELSQLPLRLAWAITIHKSQGMSLDAIEVDLSKSFVKGMGYVALSRVKSLDGLKLLGLNDTALRVDQEVFTFDRELKGLSKVLVENLRKMDAHDLEKKHNEFISRIKKSTKKESKLSTLDKTKLLLDEKISLEDMAEERGMTEETIISHLERLNELDPFLDISYLKPKGEHFEKILQTFQKLGNTKLTPTKSLLGSNYSFKEIRLARLFI